MEMGVCELYQVGRSTLLFRVTIEFDRFACNTILTIDRVSCDIVNNRDTSTHMGVREELQIQPKIH